MTMEEEFNVLDDFVEEISEKYGLVGLTKEATERVRSNGHGTSFYYMTTSNYKEEILNLTQVYYENPNLTPNEIKTHFDKNNYDPTKFYLTLVFFLAEEGSEPEEQMLEAIVSDLESAEGLPRGSYTVALHDNRIGIQSATGDKENSLIHGIPHEVIKE